MSPLVPLALFGWVPLSLGLFMFLPPRRAAIVTLIGGWLLLPIAGYEFKGLPEYDKVTATALSVVLGTLIFAPRRLLGIRWRWTDLPIVVWCLSPVASSLSNGLGLYDGLSESLTLCVTWGAFYVIGRAYFGDPAGLRELMLGVLAGGLVYVPLCLVEIRLSPQLHHWVYGYHQHNFAQTIRMGGFRPTVFLQHGLAVGVWMAAAALVGLCLWRFGRVRQVWGLPMSAVVGAVGVTAVLCKSLGALGLMGMALGALGLAGLSRSRLPLAALVLVAPAYLLGRSVLGWQGAGLLDAAAIVSQERADSLAFRFQSEAHFVDRARQRPLLGWGGWSRWWVYDDKGQLLSVPDGMWVIALGKHGVLGLGALFLALLLPAARWVRARPIGEMLRPQHAATLSAALVTVVYTIDNLLNAMVNPVFIAALAGLAGCLTAVSPAAGAHRVASAAAGGGPGPRPEPRGRLSYG